MIREILGGTGISAVISAAGWRAKALTGGGAFAATLVGSAILRGTSWRGAVILGSFFVSSSALSRVARDPGIAAKGSRRDERQVLANGGVAAVAALLPDPRQRYIAMAGALAAATADTWATEIGSTSRATPVLIMSRRRVPAGASGGVTRRGTFAALGGAAFIAVLAGAAGSPRLRSFGSVPFVLLGGLSGSIIDSVLGELVQERRYCPRCARPTEARFHHCGTPTAYTGGLRGVDNDIVNLACTLTGAVVAGLAAARQPSG